MIDVYWQQIVLKFKFTDSGMQVKGYTPHAFVSNEEFMHRHLEDSNNFLIWIKSIGKDRQHYSVLISSKLRVASLQPATLPRPEICEVLLFVHLIKVMKKALH